MNVLLVRSTCRYLPLVGYLFIAPSALIVAALGAWIVVSGVPSVRGVDLNVVLTLEKAFRLPLYTDPGEVPFDIAQYAPIYYLSVLGIARAVGIDAGNAVGLVGLARGISFACALALVTALYATSHRILNLPRNAALAVATLSFILTSPWFFLARPDAMAALLAVASIAVTAQAAKPIGMSRLFVSISFAILATFTKQNEVQVVIFCLVYLALVHGWRRAAAGAIMAAVLGLLAFGVCVFQWPYFISNVAGGLDNGISLSNFLNKTLINYLYPQAALVGLASLAVLKWSNNPGDPSRGELLQ
jgi:hypothetical protein